MKEYIKPELEIISFVAEEPITMNEDIGDNMGSEMSVVPNPFG